MKFLKLSFAFFWAVWGVCWFMLVVSIFTILYAITFAIFGKKYVMQCVWINCHYLTPFLLKVWLIRVKQHGRENIDNSRHYVFVSNHLTQLDIIVSAGTVPQPVRFLAKAEIKKIPFFGYMTQMLALMVDRSSKESRHKSMLYMAEELRKGRSLFLYPEGTRNRTGLPLKDFKDGAFKVAIMAQMPIAVQTLVGTKKLNDPNGLQLLPGTVDVYWSKPVETTGMTLDDVSKLSEMVRQEMMASLLKNGR